MKYSAYHFSEYVEQELEKLPASVYRDKSTREAKKLIEEYLPLSKLALLFQRPGIEITVETTEDGCEADGIIYESGYKTDELHIQIAHGYDHEEALRIELLNSQGFSPGSGPIRRDKKTKKIIAEYSIVDFDDYFHRLKHEVIRLLELKYNKNYEKKMVLLISFSEVKFLGLPSWVKLYNMVSDTFKESHKRFQSVYLFNEASNEIHRVA